MIRARDIRTARLLPLALVLAAGGCGDAASPPPAQSSAAPAAAAPAGEPRAAAPAGEARAMATGSPGSSPAPVPAETPMPGNSEPIPAEAPDRACGADKAARFVGRKATPAVRAEVAAAVGERPIRWIGPGDVVTMDFSETRLNMMLDDGGTITAARCG